MKEIFIYGLKDPLTNDIRYVGKTTNVKRRFSAHISRSKRNKYHSATWINSLIKNGYKPILEVIEVANSDNWVERKKYWITYYRSLFDLTNILEGGDGGSTFVRLGKKWTDKQHENNKIARTGLKINQNDKNGLRKKGINDYWNRNKKPILQYSLEGVFIREWVSSVDCGKETGFNYNNINRSCKNSNKTSHGFIWRYKEDEILLKIDPYVKSDPWNKGISLPIEMVNKISESHKNKPWSELRRNSQKIKT